MLVIGMIRAQFDSAPAILLNCCSTSSNPTWSTNCAEPLAASAVYAVSIPTLTGRSLSWLHVITVGAEE